MTTNIDKISKDFEKYDAKYCYDLCKALDINSWTNEDPSEASAIQQADEDIGGSTVCLLLFLFWLISHSCSLWGRLLRLWMIKIFRRVPSSWISSWTRLSLVPVANWTGRLMPGSTGTMNCPWRGAWLVLNTLRSTATSKGTKLLLRYQCNSIQSRLCFCKLFCMHLTIKSIYALLSIFFEHRECHGQISPVQGWKIFWTRSRVVMWFKAKRPESSSPRK